MRLKWLNKTPPLSPAPSEAELSWWSTKRAKIGFKHGLVQFLPFVAVFTIVGIIRGRYGILMFVTIPLIGLLASLLSWATTEKYHRSQHIRWKRVREELGVPTELP